MNSDPWGDDADDRGGRHRAVRIFLGVAWIVAALLLVLGTWFFFIRPPS